MSIRLLLSIALYAPVLALADAPAVRPAFTPPPPATVSGGSIMQILFSLILVLAAVVAVAWIMKRLNLQQQGQGHMLKVISGVAVGPRERVVLVEVNDTWLVLGVAPGQVRALHTLPKGSVPPGVAASANNVADGKFQMWLKQMMEKRNAP